MADFTKERAFYLSVKDKLLSEHSGEFVAIYNGRLIATNNDKGKLIAEVRKQLGPVRAFIQKIEENEPLFRLPSMRRLPNH